MGEDEKRKTTRRGKTYVKNRGSEEKVSAPFEYSLAKKQVFLLERTGKKRKTKKKSASKRSYYVRKSGEDSRLEPPVLILLQGRASKIPTRQRWGIRVGRDLL